MTDIRITKKEPVGCLLVHGFTGNPNEFIDIADLLASKQITTSIPTLPGHGTHPGDMLNFTWRDWFDCVKMAYTELARLCDEVFVCGQSMGGSLALHLAAHEEVRGVISLAGAVKFPGWKKAGVRLFKHVLKYRNKRNGEDINNTDARNILGSYRRYPYFAVDQLFKLTDHVRNDLPEINKPILIMHSPRDHTVDFSNAGIIYNSVGSKEKRRIDLVESYHVITVDYEKEIVRQEIFNFIQKYSSRL
jgi:carboxylesterase